MSRRRRGTRYYEANALTTNVNRVMTQRRDAMCPFPFAALDVYNAMWSEDELETIERINKSPSLQGALRLDDDLRFEIEGMPGCIVYIDSIGKMMPMPARYGTPSAGLVLRKRHPMYQGIRDWADKYRQYEAESERAAKYIEPYINAFKTWSQVCRAWPALANLFPGTAQDKVVRNLKRVRMPDDYWEDPTLPMDQRVPAPDFHPNTQALYEHWFTEGLMVGDAAPCIARVQRY